MSDTTASNQTSAGSIAALAGAVIIGYLSIDLSPVLLGAVKDSLALSPAQAGLLTTLELVGFGLASILSSPWIPNLPPRRTVVGAGVVVVVAHGVSAVSQVFVLLAAMRLLAGVSAGIVTATAYALVARLPRSKRIYSICFIAVVSLSGVCFVALPRLVAHFGHVASYGLVAVLALAAFPLVARIPDIAAPRDGSPARGGSRSIVVLLLVAIPVISFSDGLVWPFAERLGRAAAIAPQMIGLVLAASFFSGLSGSYLAGRLGHDHGYTVPILVGAWGTAIGGWLMTNVLSLPGYVAGTFAKNILIFFLVPYLLDAAATIDPRGRASAAAGGLFPLGVGLAPVVAGEMIERSGYAVLGWTGLGAVLVATVLLVPVFTTLRMLSQHR